MSRFLTKEILSDSFAIIVYYLYINMCQTITLPSILFFLMLYWCSPVTFAVYLCLVNKTVQTKTNRFVWKILQTLIVLFAILVGVIAPFWFVVYVLPVWIFYLLWWYLHTVVPLNWLFLWTGLIQFDASTCFLDYIRQHWIRFALMPIALDALDQNCFSIANAAMLTAAIPDMSGTTYPLLGAPRHHLVSYFRIFEKELLLPHAKNAKFANRFTQLCYKTFPLRRFNPDTSDVQFLFYLTVCTMNIPKAISLLLLLPSRPPPQTVFQSWFDLCLYIAQTCPTQTKQNIAQFIQALISHFGYNAVKEPRSLLARALGLNATLAKYLILHTTTRFWLSSRTHLNGPDDYKFVPTYLRRIRVVEREPTCLSPDDIEELYCHQVDTRYLLRLITNDPLVRDGGEVLCRLEKWKRRGFSVLHDTLIQFPVDLISLIFAYF